jgi:hypothetical protein
MRKLFLALTILLVALPALGQVTITNVFVSASTATTATINWTTSGPATSMIRYGYDTTLPYNNNATPALVTSHSMTLTVLNASRPYYFAVVSVDGSGNTTQSTTEIFALCGQPFNPATGTVNNYYEYGTFTMTWVPPVGSSGTPTACGQPINTTVTGNLSGGGSFSSSVADSYMVVPGPGTWTITVADVGDLSPITITYPLSAQNSDVSQQLQAAASTAGLVGVLANTINDTCYPAFVCSGSAGTVTKIIAGANITISPLGGTGNVTINATGMGDVLPAVLGELAGYTQAGTVATVGASSVSGPLVDFVTPILQGQANAAQFVSGGGNNAIANALAAGQTNIMVPSYYTGTDNLLFTAMPLGGAQLFDYRYGDFARAHLNYGQGGYNIAEFEDCAVGPTITNPTYCLLQHDIDASTGPYTAGLWNSHVGLLMDSVKVAQDIHQVIDINDEEVGGGDAGTFYIYTTNSTRTRAGGDESNLTMSMEQITPPPSVGTVSTGGGGAGAELIQTNMTDTVGQGRDLVSTSELQASGNIVSLTTPGGIAPNLINTSDTHTASTAIGTFNGACGANVNPTLPVTTVCPIVTTSGTFTATPSVGTYAKVCIADYQHPEEVDITAASPTSLTMKLTYSHQSGMSIFQGSCGGALVMGMGYTNPFTGLANQVTTYFVSGAPTTTSYAYVVMFNEGQNGNVPLQIPYNFSNTITNATRTGSSIAIEVTNPAVNFNSYAIPSGAQISITGNSNSNLNVSNITATTTSAQGFTVNGTSAGTAGSGTGGTLFVGGLNNYFIYCMATITQINGVNRLAPTGNGQFGLTPNTCTWANSAPLLLANAYNQAFSNMRISSIATVPPEASIIASNIQVERDMGGAAWSGGIGNCWSCASNDPADAYEGYGGILQGHLMDFSNQLFHGYMDVISPIPSGSAAFGTPDGFFARFLPPPTGGSGISTFDFLETFSDAGGIGESDEIIDRNLGLWTWNGQGGIDVIGLAQAGGVQSFSFNNLSGLLVSNDETLGTNWNCIAFNWFAPPTTDRQCRNLSVAGIEADQTMADPFLHFEYPLHTGGFKFGVLNSGGTAYDIPVEIIDGGIIVANLGSAMTKSVSGLLTPAVAGTDFVAPPISNAVTSATGGSGTGAVTCVTAACTNLRGTYTVAGGSFTTGTLLTLVWPTTTTAYACNGTALNSSTGASVGYNSVATATGMTVSALTTVAGVTVNIAYNCQP